MNYIFCTLFDKNYLYKGLALYQSLLRQCDQFTLWILCMDELTYITLEKLQLENVRLIALEDFEDDALLQAKQDRTPAEYCWTCTAPLVLYTMQQEAQAPHVAYLDADLFFYSDPDPIYDELDNNSILIIEHRYAPQYQSWASTSGIYNVGMLIFRNNSDAIECLDWWKEQCLLACYQNPEAGLFGGDQLYLDDWPSQFNNVVVLQHKGGGLAPWNVSNYNLHRRNGSILVDSDRLIFYHFHSLQLINRKLLAKRLYLASTGYSITKQQLKFVYNPYAHLLSRSIKLVKDIDPAFAWGYMHKNWRGVYRTFRQGNLLLA